MNPENPPPIDINQADEKTLTQLRGVGTRMARRIIAARPFESIDDLPRVRGISTRDVERLRPFIMVSGTPIQPDIIEEAMVEDQPEELESLESIESEVDESIEETVTKPELATEEVSPDMLMPIPEIEGEAETHDEKVELEYPAEESQIIEGEEFEKSLEAEPDRVFEELEPVIEEPGEEIPIAELPTERRPAYLSRSRAFGLFLFTFVFSVILAVAITLGILASLNRGGLSYAAPSQVIALQTQLNSISAQTDLITEDLESLRTRMDNLEALSGRVGDVETAVDSIQSEMFTLQTDIEAAQVEVDELSLQMESINEEIETLATQNNRFEYFLEGLRDLIKGLFPETQE